VKKALVVIACFAALDALSPPAGLRLEAQGTSSLVISQVYGGGGNLGATLTHDFIEIFNRGTTPVSLTGWSLQYTSAAGTTWQVTPLSGSIAPGQYYLDADFPEVLRGDPGRPERLSDHDPAVARFFFPLDTIAPVFGPVSNVTATATAFDGASVVYTSPTATDSLDQVVPVLCAPASGTFFPVGSTTVSCTASDVAGNTATTSFTVTVTLSDDAGATLESVRSTARPGSRSRSSLDRRPRAPSGDGSR
jgi:HYR domain/Lamin Tail Domain